MYSFTFTIVGVIKDSIVKVSTAFWLFFLSCCPSFPLNQHASAGNPLKNHKHISLIARPRLGMPKEHKKYQQQALEESWRPREAIRENQTVGSRDD